MAQAFVYVLLHKPTETVTTLSDEKGRTNVRELIDLPERIFPIGRLDYKTSGVLLLTNDGELSQLLTHPRYGVRKVYEVVVQRRMQEEHIERLQKGVVLEDGRTQPCRIEYLRSQGVKAIYRITVKEGRNRLIRRLIEHFGYNVRQLSRVEFGGMTTGNLKPGQWRIVSKPELEKLRARIGKPTARK
ncbi:MAG: pseudouridine synthase [Candidatus Delongbacteria bacterium]|nr:pseudouridine synthase [Candidatus Delongbacteria bacterium]